MIFALIGVQVGQRLALQEVVPSRSGGANQASLGRRLSQFFFCQPKTLFPVDLEEPIRLSTGEAFFFFLFGQPKTWFPVESEEPITPLYAGGYRNFFLVNRGGPSKSNRRSQSL